MVTVTSSQADDETWCAIWVEIKTGMTLLRKRSQVMMEVHDVVTMNVMMMAAPRILLEVCYIFWSEVCVIWCTSFELVYAIGFLLCHRLGDYNHRDLWGYCKQWFHSMLQCPAEVTSANDQKNGLDCSLWTQKMNKTCWHERWYPKNRLNVFHEDVWICWIMIMLLVYLNSNRSYWLACVTWKWEFA